MKNSTRVTLVGVGLWATTVMAVVGRGGTADLKVGGSASLGSPHLMVRGSDAQAANVDYAREIAPLIKEYCLECHSQDKRKGGLSLATWADTLDGGRNGAIVMPGNGTDSAIVRHLTGALEPQMPKDEFPLSDADIARIRRWIDQGARATPTSPPAPQPWIAPLGLAAPTVPARTWDAWDAPVDRYVSAYLATDNSSTVPRLIDDAAFVRRVYLDIWGLLPPPDAVGQFQRDTRTDKRARLVDTLLADTDLYADHWVSFWNDLLRNDDGVSYFSETAGRKSITDWLTAALQTNMPYDRFVTSLLNPKAPGDPDGFLIGVNWRGEVSASQQPAMQAAQNTAQVFLGVNLKCNACHDSFISKWKLKDAYGLASFFSADPKMQLFRCDVAQAEYAEPAFLYPELNRASPSSSLADRRATLAAIVTDPKNGRLPRTLVNRLWTRFLGRGIVDNSDEMDRRPWNPALLDWLASDFVTSGYDMKHTIATILKSRTYQLPAVSRTGEMPRTYVFRGPEVRRLTAEQFGDAIGSITGEWSISASAGRRVPAPAPAPAAPAQPAGGAQGAGAAPVRTSSDPVTVGGYVREWRAASTDLSRALGRPIRDQVISSRPTESTTFQALELVNGDTLNRWLTFGAQRMIGELPAEPTSLFNRAVAGRNAATARFDIDVTGESRLWLLVTETGSNAPDRVEPVWSGAEFVGPDGVVLLSSLTPVDASGLRPGASPVTLNGTPADGVRVKNPSRLVYDISGRGFTRFRGAIGLENRRADIGATLNPSTRFFVFDTEPNMERLLPPTPDPPRAGLPPVKTPAEAVDRVFRHSLGRPPAPAERRLAERMIEDPARPGRVSASGLADLIWAVLMKPEFQLIR